MKVIMKEHTNELFGTREFVCSHCKHLIGYKNSHYSYCPYCGKKIKEYRFKGGRECLY